MRILTLVFTLFICPLTFAQNLQNYSDNMDANDTPAPLEERENEIGNMPDNVDKNDVPAQYEPREEQEDIDEEELVDPGYDLLESDSVYQ